MTHSHGYKYGVETPDHYTRRKQRVENIKTIVIIVMSIFIIFGLSIIIHDTKQLKYYDNLPTLPNGG